ncbi:SHOCT domain-containing protein [Streptomyces sp. NPDC059680]|uniref:SHOCT domain-containing protein n=1 Tax=Streptomyces TaxID=1883 RepID=UPI001E4189C8|nr:SHOCT domain-containing protein [Streptomyces barringtoniae]MCC5475767.1 SHOCT domain-containing protein [Streptomyces barringtoniae]
MMFWYGHGMHGWGWVVMSLGTLLFWALIITVGVLLFRALARPTPRGVEHGAWQPAPGSGAEQILAERYARGEIDDEEYHRRLATLRGSSAGPSRPSGPPGR